MAAPIADGRSGESPNDVAFTSGVETVNAITTNLILKTGVTAIAAPAAVTVYLSSDAAGAVPIAAQTSLVVGGTGKLLGTLLAATTLVVLSNTSGSIDLVVTDTGVYGRYLNVILPNGTKVTSPVFTFA